MAHKVYTRFGYMNLDTKRPLGLAYLGFWFYSILWTFLGVCMVIASISIGEIVLLALGVPFILLGVGFFLIFVKKYHDLWWEHKRAYEEKKDKKTKTLFFNKCLEQGVLHMQSPAFRKKAQLIADDLGLQIADIVSYFEAASNTVRQQELDKIKRDEKTAYSVLTRYVEYTGHNKKEAMLSDMITVKNNEIEELLSPVVNSEDARRSETDWATFGGIASGLAGPAAGIATAVQISQQNAQIRQDNAELTRLQHQYLAVVSGDISRLKNQIADLEEQIESNRIKVISETAPAQIMKNLTVTEKETLISETGAFLVKATVVCNSPVKIYNEFLGVVDGTIAADLYQGKELVGSALMALPCDGVGDKPVIIEGMALTGADRAKGYKVKFRPYNLWEIEK